MLLIKYLKLISDHVPHIWVGIRAIGEFPYDWRWIGNGRLVGNDHKKEFIDDPGSMALSVVARISKKKNWKMNDANCYNTYLALCQRR